MESYIFKIKIFITLIKANFLVIDNGKYQILEMISNHC